MTLRRIVKNNQHVVKERNVVKEGMHTLQAYTERNTTFVTQKAISLQIFGVCITSGMGILESCKVGGIATGFNYQVVWKWGKDIYVDIFGIVLDKQLESGRGKHPKWVSLISHENFRADMRKFVLDNAYVKGPPNSLCRLLSPG